MSKRTELYVAFNIDSHDKSAERVNAGVSKLVPSQHKPKLKHLPFKGRERKKEGKENTPPIGHNTAIKL